MAEFNVAAPDKQFTGQVAGVSFVQGAATVPDDKRAALAYFRRRGYKVERVDEPKRAPSRAKKSDDKADE